MRYQFKCTQCGNVKDFFRSIHVGPPTDVLCSKCSQKMIHQMSGAFILKGHGFPGKDLKRLQHEAGKEREKDEQKQIELRRDQINANEVLRTRRKGRKAVEQLKRDRPEKWKQYNKSMKKGIKGE